MTQYILHNSYMDYRSCTYISVESTKQNLELPSPCSLHIFAKNVSAQGASKMGLPNQAHQVHKWKNIQATNVVFLFTKRNPGLPHTHFKTHQETQLKT